MVQNEEKLIKNTHYVPEENLSDNGNTPLIDLYAVVALNASSFVKVASNGICENLYIKVKNQYQLYFYFFN
jgi:hypothetical protein